MAEKSASVAPAVTVISVTGSYRAPYARSNLPRQLLAQAQHPGHRGVLIAPPREPLARERGELGRRVEIGKSLRQVDGAVFLCEARHHGEDADANRGEAGRRDDCAHETVLSRWPSTISKLLKNAPDAGCRMPNEVNGPTSCSTPHCILHAGLSRPTEVELYAAICPTEVGPTAVRPDCRPRARALCITSKT